MGVGSNCIHEWKQGSFSAELVTTGFFKLVYVSRASKIIIFVIMHAYQQFRKKLYNFKQLL